MELYTYTHSNVTRPPERYCFHAEGEKEEEEREEKEGNQYCTEKKKKKKGAACNACECVKAKLWQVRRDDDYDRAGRGVTLDWTPSFKKERERD